MCLAGPCKTHYHPIEGCRALQFCKTHHHPNRRVSCGSRLEHVRRWNEPCSGACSIVQPKDNEMKVVAIILKWVQFLQGKKKTKIPGLTGSSSSSWHKTAGRIFRDKIGLPADCLSTPPLFLVGNFPLKLPKILVHRPIRVCHMGDH